MGWFRCIPKVTELVAKLGPHQVQVGTFGCVSWRGCEVHIGWRSRSWLLVCWPVQPCADLLIMPLSQYALRPSSGCGSGSHFRCWCGLGLMCLHLAKPVWLPRMLGTSGPWYPTWTSPEPHKSLSLTVVAPCSFVQGMQSEGRLGSICSLCTSWARQWYGGCRWCKLWWCRGGAW